MEEKKSLLFDSILLFQFTRFFCMEWRTKMNAGRAGTLCPLYRQRKHGTQPAGGAVRVTDINQYQEEKECLEGAKSCPRAPFFLLLCGKKFHNFACVTLLTNPLINLLTFYKVTV